MTKKCISVIKERLPGEKRVILTPASVRQFVRNGFAVYVEKNAGLGLDIPDQEYRRAGAKIVTTKEAWTSSDVILKYKAPVKEEYPYLRPGMHLGAIFHAEGNRALVETLCKKKVTAYSYEFFQNREGLYPLAFPGAEISGNIAVLYGAFLLQSHFGGRGVLLPHITGTTPCHVVVIGYGNAGGAAIRTAATLGARVTVFGTNAEKLRKFAATVPANVTCLVYTKKDFQTALQSADLVIGAILISTFTTPALLDAACLKMMKKGSVIVDVTCGYGAGYMPTFDAFTSFQYPSYIRNGVVHCKIDILPSAYPLTTTEAFNAQALPYLLRMARAIYSRAKDEVSRQGRITHEGKITHPVVEEHMEILRKLAGH